MVLCSLVDMNLLQIGINSNPLNTELNPICHLLALLGAHHILHVSRVRVNMQQVSKIVSIASYLMGTGNAFPICKVTMKLMTCLATRL
jgi:hypothetical protein